MKEKEEEKMIMVTFASSFRLSGVRGGQESPNINHGWRDGEQTTLCGLTGWIEETCVKEPVSHICCLRCRKKVGL